jgi:hypothetical protein
MHPTAESQDLGATLREITICLYYDTQDVEAGVERQGKRRGL